MARAYRQRGWWKRGDRAHREGEIQPRPARSDDARFERGRGSQSDQERSGQAVVMISADTDADKVSQCIELGADDFS